MEIDDENLVAFLDGELSAEEAKEIENAAASNDSLRQRIKQLNQSWAMLDELPGEKLNRDVAQSTIEMVSLAIEDDQLSGARKRRVLGLVAMVALAMCALGAGAGATRALSYSQEQKQLRELHIVVASERLRKIPSPEFLEMLAGVDLLMNAPGPGFQPVDQAAVRVFQTSDMSERKAWIENLEPQEKQLLAEKYDNYNKSSAAKRKAAQELATYVMQQGDRRSQLFRAANAYYYLAQNAQFEQAMAGAIRNGDQQEQLELIVEELAYNYQLSEIDIDTILRWAEFWAAESQVAYAFRDAGLDLQLDQLVFHNLDLPEESSNITAADIDWLMDDLQGYSHDLLAALPSGLRRDVVSKWFADASLDTVNVDAMLKERFSELPRNKKSEVLLLPLETAQEQLTAPPVMPTGRAESAR